MCITSALAAGCASQSDETPWVVDRFDDIKVIRYEVPGFEALPLEEKELVYYLAEAAKCGRDILFDQNCAVNLPVRRTLETVYEYYAGDRTTAEWKALEKYLKKMWFANGIHHHYSNDKFVPEFTESYLRRNSTSGRATTCCSPRRATTTGACRRPKPGRSTPRWPRPMRATPNRSPTV